MCPLTEYLTDTIISRPHTLPWSRIDWHRYTNHACFYLNIHDHYYCTMYNAYNLCNVGVFVMFKYHSKRFHSLHRVDLYSPSRHIYTDHTFICAITKHNIRMSQFVCNKFSFCEYSRFLHLYGECEYLHQSSIVRRSSILWNFKRKTGCGVVFGTPNDYRSIDCLNELKWREPYEYQSISIVHNWIV